MIRRTVITACTALAALAPAASAADRVPGEVIVRYAPGTSAHARGDAERAAGLERPQAFAPRARALRVRRGGSVAAAIARVRTQRGVASAAPNYVARTAFVPNDPGDGAVPGGWQA